MLKKVNYSSWRERPTAVLKRRSLSMNAQQWRGCPGVTVKFKNRIKSLICLTEMAPLDSVYVGTREEKKTANLFGLQCGRVSGCSNQHPPPQNEQ